MYYTNRCNGTSLLEGTRTWASCLVVGLVFACCCPAAGSDLGLEIVIGPPEKGPGLPEALEHRVDGAIKNGLDYLRRTQLKSGSWSPGGKPQLHQGDTDARAWPIGYCALPALAMLHCGVPADDPAIQKAASFIRANVISQTRTYEISLAIVFLDQLGEAEDRPLIRSLGLRLACGQGPFGGWSYGCPLLKPAFEKEFGETLRARGRKDVPNLEKPKRLGPLRGEDNSNTQFALLGLWVARRYDVVPEYPLAFAEKRFRVTQEHSGGWDYDFHLSGRDRAYGSMTCAGLLGLFTGRASAPMAKEAADHRAVAADEGISEGLRALATFLRDPSDTRGVAGTRELGAKGALNYYFLWSVERTGVLCNLRTIGGVDWYRWGVDLLLPAQRKDGAWLGRGAGGSLPIDTSFALLFLKRADLLPDLREALQKRLKIIDPAVDQEPLPPKKKGGPGKVDPKKGSADPKKPAGTPGATASSYDTRLIVNLGDVKLKQATDLPVKVKGPAAYRIKGVRGADVELRVSHDGESRETQLLVLTLTLEQTGDFERTLYLQTDIPGRAEVPIQVRARAVDSK